MAFTGIDPPQPAGRLLRVHWIPIEVAAAVTVIGWCGMWAEALDSGSSIAIDVFAAAFLIGIGLITVSRRTEPRGLFWRS